LVKSLEVALSEVQLSSINAEFSAVAETRILPGGKIVGIGSSCHLRIIRRMTYHIHTVRGETTQNARTMNHCSSPLPQIAAAISKNGASKMKMLAQSKTSRNGMYPPCARPVPVRVYVFGVLAGELGDVRN
jgi:hypothetical protein